MVDVIVIGGGPAGVLVRELGLTPLSPIWRELCQVPQPVAEWETHVV
jgi:hypothetical protein